MSNVKKTTEEISKRPYGLGIFATAPKMEQTFEKNAARYQYEAATGIRVSAWMDEMRDEKIISEQFDGLKFSDEYFARSFENFGGGLVVVAEKGSDIYFEFSTIIEKSGSDLIFIIAEEDAVLRVFETAKSEVPVFFGRNIFVSVGKGASVTFAGTAEISAGSSYLSRRSSRVLADGKMEWFDLHAGEEMVRSLSEDTLAEAGAESYSYNMSLCSEGHFDLYNTAHHAADHTASHIFSRGIAGGGGKIVYRALSDISNGVIGATGRQEGRFLITSSGAEVDAIPSLDIGSSESNSSHALSISHLTDKDFFYPALRGIAPYRAQAMLLSGFLAKPLLRLPEEWQKKILEKINKKLSSPVFRMGE
ncbi:MAG: SufD family Fe-S cluster assembly protein [Candidatus Paceibacterota bacterium]|jgi:Fe-S cluster assembly scaffold protein SufB|nr:SufD family Fe-S cluster assembly protein [Candidatus Paceibacterota bacterium]